MRYLECILDTPETEIDTRCSKLEEMGVEGFIIETEKDFRSFLENNRQYWDYVDRELEERYAGLSRLKFYLTDNLEGQELFEKVKKLYPDVTRNVVEDSDWENNWRSYYQPIEVGEKLVVVPEWIDLPESKRLPLRLDPGLIFGTGSHPTTKMCLSMLEQTVTSGEKVLDLGCGSGILGIGALILGAGSCLGVDIDPKAPDVACANAALNGLSADCFRVISGDLILDSSLRNMLGTGYDIVLANIVADVIIPLSVHAHDYLHPGGTYITSGIIDGRQDEVCAAIISAGFQITAHINEDDWHCFTAIAL